MAAPFEGLLGDTSELRTVQFLLPVKGLKFNISELARETGISRQTMVRVVKKLVKWNVLKIASKHGGVNYYTLNEDSGFIEAFEKLNNRIIEQMLGEEKLAEIANYQLKPAQVCTAPKLSKPGYMTG
jgi:DNA-binding transcriptional regulator GbsR (MarR family)